MNTPLTSDVSLTSGSAVPAPAASAFRVQPQDGLVFSARQSIRLRHNFHRHPLMQLDALRALAHELQPVGGCRFIEPGTGEASEFLHHDRSPDGRPIDAVFDRIEEPGSWIALYNVERVPRYGRFLDDVVATMRAQVEREQGPIFLVTGFIFISAPPSVTPFHIDRENNFWLQIRGRKALTVWPAGDPAIVPHAVADDFIVFGDLTGVRLDDARRARGDQQVHAAGDGLYFPSTTPHMTMTRAEWAAEGDPVSISIGITFYTQATRRHARVHQLNRVLRRLGLNPTPPGQSDLLDHLKAPLGRVVRRLLEWHRPDYRLPPGGA